GRYRREHARVILCGRHSCEKLCDCNRRRASLATRVNGHGGHGLSLASGLESTKSNIRRLMVSTSGGTSGPVNRQRISPRTECFVESLGKRDGAAFRFDESKIAVVRADASHHVAQKGRRARRELL